MMVKSGCVYKQHGLPSFFQTKRTEILTLGGSRGRRARSKWRVPESGSLKKHAKMLAEGSNWLQKERVAIKRIRLYIPRARQPIHAPQRQQFVDSGEQRKGFGKMLASLRGTEATICWFWHDGIWSQLLLWQLSGKKVGLCIFVTRFTLIDTQAGSLSSLYKLPFPFRRIVHASQNAIPPGGCYVRRNDHL